MSVRYATHDDIDTSVLEGIKYSNSYFMIISRIWMIKNEVDSRKL